MDGTYNNDQPQRWLMHTILKNNYGWDMQKSSETKDDGDTDYNGRYQTPINGLKERNRRGGK